MSPKAKPMPVKEMTELLVYDSDSGLIRWGEDSSLRARQGGLAFNRKHHTGYMVGGFLGKTYQAHRVAWVLHYGVDPINEIDHINGNKCDNRIENLRVVDRIKNCQNTKLRSNNASGYKGVHWHKHDKRWRAKIQVDKVEVFLGNFTNKEDAAEAYRIANEKYHGQYGRLK